MRKAWMCALVCAAAGVLAEASPCERAGRPGERHAAVKWALPHGALLTWIEWPASDEDDYGLIACDCRTGRWTRVQRMNPVRDNASIQELKLRTVGEGATRRELLFTTGISGAVGETTLAFKPVWNKASGAYQLVKVLEDRSRLLKWDERDAGRAYGVIEWEWRREGPGAPARYRTWQWDGEAFRDEGVRTGWPPP